MKPGSRRRHKFGIIWLWKSPGMERQHQESTICLVFNNLTKRKSRQKRQSLYVYCTRLQKTRWLRSFPNTAASALQFGRRTLTAPLSSIRISRQTANIPGDNARLERPVAPFLTGSDEFTRSPRLIFDAMRYASSACCSGVPCTTKHCHIG